METTARPLTAVVTHHGEGPVRDDAGTLRCVDLLAGDVLTFGDDPTSDDPTPDDRPPRLAPVDRLHVGDVAALWRPRVGGGAVVAVERGVVLLDAEGRTEREVTVFEDDSLRMNEGACDPWGRLWIGSMPYSEDRPDGVLYRVDADLTVTPVLDGLTIPNGLAWSADGSVAYHSDSPTRVVSRLVVDAAGSLVSREPWLDLDALGIAGYPDGLTVDTAGGVWVALWGAGSVVRFADSGSGVRATHRVSVPASQTSAVALGSGSTSLAITTSAKLLPAEGPGHEPLAGALFTAEAPYPGVPVRAFAG
ncbi:SMP-30/gluconolactonase/LRE family protein [Nocardioides sp. GY 10127]|nr:SMP-30/gluconolactonase/LRE family protein [Nocardioides sp. GY 10127]